MLSTASTQERSNGRKYLCGQYLFLQGSVVRYLAKLFSLSQLKRPGVQFVTLMSYVCSYNLDRVRVVEDGAGSTIPVNAGHRAANG